MLGGNALSRGWLALATVGLVLGAGAAGVVALARTPWAGDALGLRGWFAHALVLHVALATVVWLQGMLAALWTGDAADARGGAGRSSALERAALFVAAVAVLSMLYASTVGAPAVLSNYVPVLDHPAFLGGLGVFLGSVAVTAGAAIGRAARWPMAAGGAREPTQVARVALRLAAVPLLIASGSLLASGAAVSPNAWAAEAERIFWAPGHVLQFSHVLLAEAGWLWLLRHRRVHPALALAAVALTAAPALAAPLIELAWPSDSAQFRLAFTRLMQWGSWPGPLLLVASLLWAGKGTAPRAVDTRSAASPMAWVSIALFVGGVLLATMIRGETTMVPAHYHATVGAATLAGIAMLVEHLAQRMRAPGSLRAVAPTYASGFLLLIAGLAVAGFARMPRKLPDPQMLSESLVARGGLLAMAVGATLAVGALLWLGLRIGVLARFPMRDAASPASSASGCARQRRSAARGTDRVDRRGRALATTLVGVAMLGTALTWLGGPSTPAATPAQRGPLEAEVHQRFQQGVWMLHARQYDHALVAFHRVIEVVPDMPEAHVNIGYALLGLERHREARAFFESAIELRAEQFNAYYGLASALEALGDVGGAIGAMRTFAHLVRSDDPYLPRARAALWEWESRERPAPTARR